MAPELGRRSQAYPQADKSTPQHGDGCHISTPPNISVGGVDSQGCLQDASYTTNVDQNGSIGAIAGAGRGAESRKWTLTKVALTPLHSPLCHLPSSFQVARDSLLLGSSSRSRGLIGRNRKGSDQTEQRQSFWAGYWEHVISVELQCDVAQSAIGLRDKMLDYKPPLYRAHLDIGW